MAESSEGANLANTIRGLKKFDGRNPAEFKTWMKKLCVVRHQEGHSVSTERNSEANSHQQHCGVQQG